MNIRTAGVFKGPVLTGRVVLWRRINDRWRHPFVESGSFPCLLFRVELVPIPHKDSSSGHKVSPTLLKMMPIKQMEVSGGQSVGSPTTWVTQWFSRGSDVDSTDPLS